MRPYLPMLRRALLLGQAALIALVIAGCATAPSVDWGARVGSYTYDEAVAELGVPQRVEKAPDGGGICEWVKSRRSQTHLYSASDTFARPDDVGISKSVGNTVPDKVLRLTFGPDGKLARWERNY